MNYVLFGVNHKTAPLSIREKLAFDPITSQKFLEHILENQILKEGTVLSTCNRVEIYGVADSTDEALNTIKSHLGQTLGVHLKDSEAYGKLGADVVDHLFSVVSSLDSMVVGENQIAGQVKDAFRLAQESKATGPYLNQLFHRAFSVAKRVKTETQIGKGQVSIGSVAVILAQKIFGEINECHITLLGAGEIGQTVLTALKAQSQTVRVTLVNRTLEKANHIMDQAWGEVKPLHELWSVLQDSQILISSLSQGFEELSEEQFKTLMTLRKNAPLFLIDLGVPRNIDAKVEHLHNIYLYNIDDLQKIASENQKGREAEMNEAQHIIDVESKDFFAMISDRSATPMIAKLNQKFEWIRQNELDKTLTKLKHLSEDDCRAIELMSQSIVRKILHDPILHLKTDALAKEPLALQFFRKIFSLNDEEENS